MSHDVIVVGAGIVGSALAFSLGRSGRRVLLLERDLSEPDRIVGELLQPGGVRALRLLGLGSCLDGIDAVPVEGYQVFYGPRAVPIPYPLEKDQERGQGVQSGSGKVEGRSFHHGKFVQALRRKAIEQENVTTVEATVKELLEDNTGRVVGILASRKGKVVEAAGEEQGGAEAGAASLSSSSSEDARFEAPLTIVADGCFSKFRRTHGNSIAPIVRSNFVGLELTDAPLPAPHHGHVVLGGSGPVLLYQIGSRSTRILIDVPGEKLPSASKGDLQILIREKVIPSLPRDLGECLRMELEKGQRLRSMPNSFLPPSMQGQSNKRKGVIVVGDAMNMRHPLTGGGMSVGLWDCVHLTSVLGGGAWLPSLPASPNASQPAQPEAADLQKWDADLKPALRAWHWRRKGLASVINILAQALYSLFGADDEDLEVLREGCFKYFELGGECVGGPVSLLSGLAPRPLLLVYHFFAVAIYSIYALFMHPRTSSTGETHVPGVSEYPALVWRSISVFWTACVVILPVIFTELRANVPSFTGKEKGKDQGAEKQRKGKGGLLNINVGVFLALGLLAAWLYAQQTTSSSSSSASSLLSSLTHGSTTRVGGSAAPTQLLSRWMVFPRAVAARTEGLVGGHGQ